MRAETLTKLPLLRWAQLLGINSMHFGGVYWPDHPPTVCQQPWLQRADQAADRVGREEVAQAIAQAEADIERYLGYRLLPAWEVDEWHQSAGVPAQNLVRNSMVDARGFAQTVEADWGHVISGGIRSKTVLQAAAPITYADNDGDSYKETATVSLATTVNPCEIKIYVSGKSADDAYEIKPIKVVSAVGIATITFRREQAVEPSVYDDMVPPADDSHLRGVNGSNDLFFLDDVDVYRVYNDPQAQVTFLWEPFSNGCATCTDTGCPACAYSAQSGCLLIRSNPRLGIFSYRPADWSASGLDFVSTSWATARQPDLIRLYYYAGQRAKSLGCPTVQMDPEWERIVAYYAASLLDRPICECNNARTWVAHWQEVPGSDAKFAAQAEVSGGNPFGPTNGAIFAWRRLNREGQALGRAVYV